LGTLAKTVRNSCAPIARVVPHCRCVATRDARVLVSGITHSRPQRRRERAFLSRKWGRELDYRLTKEMWAFTGNRIAVRFAYEWHDDSGRWYRSYGNENWEFNDEGLMVSRFASINDLPIVETDRKYHWSLGRRPDEHPGLSELGL
jgi:nuclear transport factor 2 (NTF2) superfamily protein